MGQTSLRISTQVLPGSRIEVTAPGLNEGDRVDVIVVIPEPAARRRSMLEILDSPPAGPRSFNSPEEADAHFQAERNSWD